ncbi:MAG: hypothetical protein ACYS9C_15615, partial [Planctomycetota bacterium]
MHGRIQSEQEDTKETQPMQAGNSVEKTKGCEFCTCAPSKLNHPQFWFVHKRNGRLFVDKSCRRKKLQEITTLLKGV